MPWEKLIRSGRGNALEKLIRPGRGNALEKVTRAGRGNALGKINNNLEGRNRMIKKKGAETRPEKTKNHGGK